MFLLEGAPDNAVAVYEGVAGACISYAELRERTRQRAEALQEGGGPGKLLIFLLVGNDAASLETYLAAMTNGYAATLLNEGLDAGLLTALLERYRPELLFGPENAPPGYIPAGPKLWKRLERGGDTPHADLALLLSTSGSTGSPKLARLSRRAVLANAEGIRQVLRIQPQDRAVTSLPMSYSYGLSVIHTHLLSGAALVLTNDGLMSQGFWETVRQRQVTSLAGVPYSFQILQRLDIDKLNIPSLSVLTQAGGKLDERRIQLFHEQMARRGGRFYVMYGQTEATARIAILPAEALPAKLGSVGLPLAGGKFTIDAAAPGEIGELIYEGPNVMMGYALERADLALGDQLQGRLRTGDRAQVDADGYLYIHGRAQRDVKLFGLRVNLDEVEGWMKVHGPTAVIGAPDRLHIFCEYGDEESFSGWRQELSGRMRVHPSAFVFHNVDKLPVKDSGKIDYQRLQERV